MTIEMPFDKILLSIEAVVALLKERFPNLSTQETTRLANDILRTVVRVVEAK